MNVFQRQNVLSVLFALFMSNITLICIRKARREDVPVLKEREKRNVLLCSTCTIQDFVKTFDALKLDWNLLELELTANPRKRHTFFAQKLLQM